jgi:hypothetical protein
VAQDLHNPPHGRCHLTPGNAIYWQDVKNLCKAPLLTSQPIRAGSDLLKLRQVVRVIPPAPAATLLAMPFNGWVGDHQPPRTDLPTGRGA